MNIATPKIRVLRDEGILKNLVIYNNLHVKITI